MEILADLSKCIEFGKINRNSPYPPNMKGEDGADELTRQALDQGVKADEILKQGLITGMEKVGIKFRENKIFVPQVLMSAKAMTAAMDQLRPYFLSGDVKQKGTFIVGTVAGDLHDIGKNLVAMMVEGNGWKVIDLGTDVSADKFKAALQENPQAIVGMSALLTTTMVNMEEIIKEIKTDFPDTPIMIGGAPINQQFSDKIGADFYSPDPQGLVEYLNNRTSELA
ncbi:MAG: cobalamin B12-binding domain-containing protein [Candidatus Cyclobacteriaceae bacterium M3_2C_046]